MSEARRGKSLSDETKKKISDGNWGKVVSDVTRLKMSASSKGKPKNYMVWNKGTPFEKRVKPSHRTLTNSYGFERICMICKKKEDDLPRSLQLHHKDMNHDNISKDNLMLLCDACHQKLHVNFVKRMISKYGELIEPEEEVE